MAAYVLFLRESAVVNETEREEYLRKLRAAPRDPRMELLALYGDVQALEGEAPDGVVLLRFPSVEAAREWYYSPHYQDAAPHRVKSAEYRGFIVEGL